jgi:hypothetical protein
MAKTALRKELRARAARMSPRWTRACARCC